MPLLVLAGSKFSAVIKPDGHAYVQHGATGTRFAITDEQWKMFAEIEVEALAETVDEFASELMCAAGVLAYDEWRACFDTPDGIAEYENESLERQREERAMLASYHRSVL